MLYAEGISVTEAVQESIQPGQATRVTDTVFEPEILAFCCEH
jgi:hypothetical protein